MDETIPRGHVAALILASFVVGLGVPDLDFLLPLRHRSALTHSVVPLLIVLLHPAGRRLLPGLALGIGVHLSADSFPNAMTGFATVKLPFAGALSAAASYIWLGANALASVAIGAVTSARVLPLAWATGLLGAVAAGSVIYLFVTDGGWPVLALAGAASAIGWRVRRRQ
ncbi:hypothetical protein M9980_13930 [Sphingomonas donggukensis]|uniref:Metal-dependent hydrolase n=1 Tax=Sphingomonas donggukensis TaxID=2949093 RepID=A0ABY4TT60_9SPHN|nr:hypothetical protein [Sphingomonas donggukensis]URW75600.1 hypothetical protein M9980_13930 [Sphingomonas donggukensis]